MATPHSESHVPLQVVTFESGDYRFGIDVLTVQEVLKHQEMTPVPLAPAEICGLINLRGNIVTAIGIRERLKMQAAPETQEQMNLIVSLRDSAASLIVDKVGDVVTLDPSRYRARPSTLVAPLSEVVTGVYELDDGLLLLLDAQALCTIGGEKQHEH
jgi:purine-binding chemotaxis protein CheW